jgi:hypothetical protein
LKAVRDAGYDFIGRYLRNLDISQMQQLSQNGLGLIPIFQNQKVESRIFTGRSGGLTDGEMANRMASNLRIPTTELIVCSVDTDVVKTNIAVLTDYVDGFMEACRHPIGLYGDWDLIEARGAKSRLNIQAAAESWSYDWTKTPTERWRGMSQYTHLRQYKQTYQFNSYIDRLEVVSPAAIIWAGYRYPIFP